MAEIITARGARLSMEELKLKSLRPLVQMGDQKNTVQPQKRPTGHANVRGFVPTMEGVARRPLNVPGLPHVEPAPVETTPTEGPSMADYTGITIERLKHLDEPPKDASEAANQTLREIMGDLDQFRAREPATQPKTRRAKSPS